jgi:C-terminal processing protease CtpA/Prc
MRGRDNTKIKLKIIRNGLDKPIEVSITRKIIRVRPVRSRWKEMMLASFESVSLTSRPWMV